MIIKSKEQTVQCTSERVFDFVSDFRNFSHLMPDQIQDYQANEDSCRFVISGMGQVSMLMSERIRPVKVVAVSSGDTALVFSLILTIRKIDDINSSVLIKLDADLSPLLSMMVKTPLQNFTDLMAEKLKLHLIGKS